MLKAAQRCSSSSPRVNVAQRKSVVVRSNAGRCAGLSTAGAIWAGEGRQLRSPLACFHTPELGSPCKRSREPVVQICLVIFEIAVAAGDQPSAIAGHSPLPLHASATAAGRSSWSTGDEGAAQVKRLISRDKKEFLGNDTDILDKYNTEFGDGPADGLAPSKLADVSAGRGNSSASPAVPWPGCSECCRPDPPAQNVRN